MTVRLDGLQRDVTSGILPGNNRAAAFLEDFDKLLKKQEANITETGERQITERLRINYQRLARSLSQRSVAETNLHNAGVREIIHQLVEVNMQRSEEHTSELQSLMRISYAVFCLKNK